MKASLRFGHRPLALALTTLTACFGAVPEDGARRDGTTPPADPRAPTRPPGGGATPDGSGRMPPANPPGVSGEQSPKPSPGACALVPRRFVPLTPAQIANTAAKLVQGGLSTDPKAPNYLDVAGPLSSAVGETAGRFSSEVGAWEPTADFGAALMEVVPQLGRLIHKSLKGADACVQAASADGACVAGWIGRMGRIAFRRPVTEEETRELVALFEAEHEAAGPAEAVSVVVQALTLSPAFLVRTERGAGGGTLNSHEVAQALSYWLVDGPPDGALAAAADADKLREPAARAAEVRRLLAKPPRPKSSQGGSGPLLLLGNVPGLQRFFYEWLEVADDPAKDDRIYGGNRGEPSYWPGVRAEFEAFLSDHLWNRGAKWTGLLTDNAAYPNQDRMMYDPTNAEWMFKMPKYPGGVCDPAYPKRPASCDGTRRMEVVRVEGADLDGPRAGLLTNALLMSSHASFDRTDAVMRGKWVRHAFLCQEPPPPPPTVAAVPPPASKTLTARERFDEHSSDVGCAACHRLMDPIGFALERYDAVGRYRTHELSPELEKKGLYFESGKAIDPSGTLADVTIDGKRGSHDFKTAGELAQLIARAEEAQSCFVSVVHAYAMGRYQDDADACTRADLQKDFVAGGFDVLDLFARVAAREDFVKRRAP